MDEDDSSDYLLSKAPFSLPSPLAPLGSGSVPCVVCVGGALSLRDFLAFVSTALRSWGFLRAGEEHSGKCDAGRNWYEGGSSGLMGRRGPERRQSSKAGVRPPQERASMGVEGSSPHCCNGPGTRNTEQIGNCCPRTSPHLDPLRQVQFQTLETQYVPVGGTPR